MTIQENDKITKKLLTNGYTIGQIQKIIRGLDDSAMGNVFESEDVYEILLGQ